MKIPAAMLEWLREASSQSFPESDHGYLPLPVYLAVMLFGESVTYKRHAGFVRSEFP